MHRFIDIHCSKRGNVKSGQPHIDNYSDLHRIVVVFELPGQLFLVRLGANNLFPVFRIVIAASHDDTNFFIPFRPQLQQFPIDLHGNRSGIGNDHRLAGQKVCSVFLIMLDDIIAERINRGIRAKNALHLSKHFLALFDGSCIGLLLKNIVCRVNQRQCILIQFQMDNTALIINRASCTILHRLGHVIDINIITKDFSGITILGRDRRSGKADESCIRQSFMDDQCIADNSSGFLFALFVFRNDNPLIKAILATMGLICHNYDISAFGQWPFAAFELKHCCKNDAIGLPAIQQGFQMLFALSLNRRLTKECRTVSKLSIELVIQVNAVRHHYDRWTIQSFLQQVRIKDHREGLTTALGMPEHTALTVGFCSNLCFFYSLLDRKVLVIACKNLYVLLAIVREENEVLQNVQQAILLEHSFIESIKCCVGSILIIAILGLPFHEAIKTGCNSTRFIGGKITDDANSVIVEYRRDVLHVVANLVEGVLRADFILGWALQFH